MSKIRLGPDGVHFFERSSGTNILFEEIIPPKNSWTLAPRQVSIALTNACDFECIHCYASKIPATLNLDSVKKWMLELDSAGCFGIGFGGGEPTLYPHLEEICRFGRDNTNLAITMTSHGHRLNESLIDSLKSSLNYLRISMDGVHNTYEKIRGHSFSRLLEKLELIKGIIPFGINFVVNDSTVFDLPRAVQIAEMFQASEFLLLPEIPYGRGHAVNQQTLFKLSEWIGSYKGNVQLSISASHHELSKSQLPLPQEPMDMAFAHIDASGVLKSCSFNSTGEKICDAGVMHAFNKLIGPGRAS